MQPKQIKQKSEPKRLEETPTIPTPPPPPAGLINSKDPLFKGNTVATKEQ